MHIQMLNFEPNGNYLRPLLGKHAWPNDAMTTIYDLDILTLSAYGSCFPAFPVESKIVKNMKIGAVTPGELRAVCEKGLLLVTIMIPEMEELLACLMVLLLDPLAREQLATQILTLCQ